MYAIAGVTGHVGSAAADALLRANKKIRVLVRDAAKASELRRRGAEVAVGSLEDARFVGSALANIEGAFLLSPPNYGTTDFRGYQARVARSLAEAVTDSAVPHVVLLSSLGADFAEGNGPIQGVHKLENALREIPAKVTALRPGFFQENTLGVLHLAQSKGIYPSFLPRQAPIPMIATRDIGAAVAAALTSPPAQSEILDLAGPPYTADDVAATLGRVLGRAVQTVEVPPEQHVGALIEAGFSPMIAELYAEMYAFFRTGKARPVGDRLVQVATPLEETLRAATAH